MAQIILKDISLADMMKTAVFHLHIVGDDNKVTVKSIAIEDATFKNGNFAKSYIKSCTIRLAQYFYSHREEDLTTYMRFLESLQTYKMPNTLDDAFSALVKHKRRIDNLMDCLDSELCEAIAFMTDISAHMTAWGRDASDCLTDEDVEYMKLEKEKEAAYQQKKREKANAEREAKREQMKENVAKHKALLAQRAERKRIRQEGHN